MRKKKQCKDFRNGKMKSKLYLKNNLKNKKEYLK